MHQNGSFAFFIRVMNESKEGFDVSEEIHQIVMDICSELRIALRDGGDYSSTGVITDQIKEAIQHCDIVFADATSTNQNVWYEIGYADRVDARKVIILHSDHILLPFDRNHMRSFPITLSKQKKIRKSKNEILESSRDILSISAIKRMLTRDQPTSAIGEYIGRRPDLRRKSIDYLRWIALDVEQPTEKRRRCITSLMELGELDDEIICHQTERYVDPRIREEILDSVALINRPLPSDVWNNALKTKRSVPVLRAMGRAATMHYLRSNLQKEFFLTKFLCHERWEVRKHISLTFFEQFPSIVDATHFLDVPVAVALDHSEEVRNRFIEYIRRIYESKRVLTDQERYILERTADASKGTKRQEVEKIRRKVEKLLTDSSQWLK